MTDTTELRAELVASREHAAAEVERWAKEFDIARAALAAHDAAVAAMTEADPPREPLSPTNLGPTQKSARAPRRNIAEEVYYRLSGMPQTIEALAEMIGGTRPAQVQAAILKLGDKVLGVDGGFIRSGATPPVPMAAEE
ncbi:MAG TPA: hypothetical protein VKS24_24750 [Bradyrhizobium sp.]|nr:hypothetical protein [Bradyrhizobium sp.]